MNTFEFEDFEWFPPVLRNSTTDFLRLYMKLSNIYKPIFPQMVEVLSRTNTNRIVDLCSGGGGPFEKFLSYLDHENKNGLKLESVTLTDLNPNIDAFKMMAVEDHRIQYIDKPVNAQNVSLEMKGMRTLFSSFHHMDPTSAEKIIENAVQAGEPIGIFEMTERSFFAILRLFIFAFIPTFILIPFSKPFSLMKILTSPIAAFTTWFDGMSSCLRTYSLSELKMFTEKVDKSHKYHWEIGKKFSKPNMCYITYLIGYQKKL